MTTITMTKPEPTPTVTEPSSAFANFVLSQIRCAELRARIGANELRATAVAPAGGLIDGEDALASLDEVGLLDFVTGAST